VLKKYLHRDRDLKEVYMEISPKFKTYGGRNKGPYMILSNVQKYGLKDLQNNFLRFYAKLKRSYFIHKTLHYR